MGRQPLADSLTAVSVEDLLRLELAVIRADDPATVAFYAWAPAARVLVADGIDAVPDAGDGYQPGTVPATVVALARRLGTGHVTASPSWLFPTGGPAATEAGMPIVTGGGAALIRPGNWQPDEWASLIGGEFGPWAMAVNGDEPVCIAHTPAATGDAAEAGVWTRPDHRGRGLAAPVVGAWWRAQSARTPVVFYSTTADNHASQAVAAKLRLIPLGWIWRIHAR
jgi:hypothetical protein